MKLSIFISIFAVCLVHGQSRGGVSSTMRSDLTGFKGSLRIKKNESSKETKGSVYLYENWNTIGVIVTNENKSMSMGGLNYDTESDVFVVKSSKDSVYMFDDTNLKEVVINKKRYKKYFNLEDGTQYYLEILARNNDIEILKKTNKKIRFGLLDPLTQISADDEYIAVKTYYLKKGDEISEIKLKKKPFCNVFGKESKAIKKFISNKNLSLSDERSLQVILNYYNTLL